MDSDITEMWSSDVHQDSDIGSPTSSCTLNSLLPESHPCQPSKSTLLNIWFCFIHLQKQSLRPDMTSSPWNWDQQHDDFPDSWLTPSFSLPLTLLLLSHLSWSLITSWLVDLLSDCLNKLLNYTAELCISVLNVSTLKHTIHSVQLLSRVQLFSTLWIAARQASLFITISQSLLKLMSINPVMPSNHLILCRPLLLPPSIFPSIRVFSNESALCIRWPKYWTFSFSISPSNEHTGLICFRMDGLDLLAVQGTLKSLLQHHSLKASILCAQLSSPSNSHIHTWLLEKP